MRNAITVAAAAITTAAAHAANVDFPRFPAIAPDASAITFSWRGDIFIAPLTPGETNLRAKRLTNHPLDELYSTFDPNARHVFFTSEQHGPHNVYRIDTDGSDPQRVTQTDSTFIISKHHPTQPAVLGHSRRDGDVYRASRPFTAGTEHGRIDRLHDAFGNLPAASPDGSRVAFERGGSSWDRRHYRGPDARDIYIHDTDDNTFTRLTTWEGNDGLPRFADDDTILFLSDRELDTVNIYRADINDDNTLDQRSVRRVTSFQGKDVQWFDVDARGRTVVLHVWDTLYTLDLNASRPPRELTISAAADLRDDVSLERLSNASTSALSPDGKTIAFVARGELFVRSTDDDAQPRRVTDTNPDTLLDGHARESNPAWSPDGLRLYFTSDADGTASIYAATVNTTRSELRDAVLARVNPDALTDDDNNADDTPAATAEADEITSYPHPAAGSWQGNAQLQGVPGMPANVPFTLTITADQDGNLAASLAAMGSNLAVDTANWSAPTIELSLPWPDGSTISLTATINDDELEGTWSSPGAAGDWSATRAATFPEPQPASDDEATNEDTEDETDNDEAEETPPHLDPDRWHDAVRFNVAPVVQTPHEDTEAHPLPDGTRISFRRNLGDIIVRDLVTDDEHTLFSTWDTNIAWRFTQNAHYTVFATSDLDFNYDVFITPTDGPTDDIPEPINLSMHPDNDIAPRISADGKVLTFLSERANEQYDVYAVYLDADLDNLPAQDLDAYFDDARDHAKSIKPLDPIDIDALRDHHNNPPAENEDADPEEDTTTDEDDHGFTADPLDPEDLRDAFLRIRRITSHTSSESNLELSRAGDRIMYVGDPGGDRALYAVDHRGGDRKKIGPAASVTGFSPFNNKANIVQSGRPGHADPGGSSKTFNFSHTLRVDLQAQASQKFKEAARTLGDEFYHPTMKDLDWDALTEQYHQLATQTRTADEFTHVGRRFLGELNGSHLGITPPSPSSDISQPSGHLAIDHTALPQPDGTVHYRVDNILFDAPAADTDMALLVGDVITHIDLEPITHSLDASLAGHVNVETIVTVQRRTDTLPNPAEDDADNPTTALDLLITPISRGAQNNRRYTDWTLSRRERVDELSDSRIGYLHIRSMGAASLDEFERDLFAAAYGKDALIIDVRNNPGGWITDRLLASIMVRPHAYTLPRGADTNAIGHYPQDRLYIQRYTQPINLLINEKSFSNAEIFAHAFDALDRGTIVGVQTYGGVISTGGFTLIDGTRVRLPFRGWFLDDGTDMENNGAKPHIVVPQTPEDESAGHDEQLETAVRELLNRIDAR